MNNRLKVLRAERDWSQAQLAEHLGVSRQTVNALETGRYDPSLPLAFKIDQINPAYAAVMGGLLAGVGLLILFRHRASLGGVNVLVLYLQERYGWRAGYVQLALDGTITAMSIPLISPSAIAMSLLGALVLNLTIAINHQPGRYVAI